MGNINDDGEAMSGKELKLQNYKCNEQNKDNQVVDSIDPLKYMDLLLQKTINNFSAIIDVTRQQYIANLRDKYVQFKNTFDKAQAMKDDDSSMTSFHGHQYDERTIPCAGENCFTQHTLQERTFNRTAKLLRHTALRRAFLNTPSKSVERKSSNPEIHVNVERQAKDFYVSSDIPLKVLNEKIVGERTIKSRSDMENEMVTSEKNVTHSDKVKREKLEDSTESMITVPVKVPAVTSQQVAELSMGTDWWNGTWFWIIDLVVLILLLILILSCCIWHCGSSSSSSSSKRSNYIRI